MGLLGGTAGRWRWVTIILMLGVAAAGPGMLRIGTCNEGYSPMVMKAMDGSFYGFEVEQWNTIYSILVNRAARSGNQELIDLVGDTPPPLIGIKGLSSPEAGLEKVRNNELDVVFCGYYLLPHRARIADPSPPLLSSGYAMVTSAIPKPPTQMELLTSTMPAVQPNGVFAFLLFMCLSFVFAHLIWGFERNTDSGMFGQPYSVGVFDGWYMAMVSATTGYGDKVPVTFAGKLITAVWITTTIYCFGMFAASITTGLVTDNLDRAITSLFSTPSDMIGFKVASYFTAAQTNIDLIEPKIGKLTTYDDVGWAYASLARGDIDVLLDDVRTAQYQVALEPYAGKLMIAGDSFMPTSYGFYVARPGGKTHMVYPLLYRSVLDYSRGNLVPVRDVNVAKFISDGSQAALTDTAQLIIANSLMNANVNLIVALCLFLFIFAAATAYSQRGEAARENERQMLLAVLGCDKQDRFELRVAAANLFKLWDVNGDQRLDVDEIAVALVSLGFREFGLREQIKAEASLTGTPMQQEDGTCSLSVADFQEMMVRLALEGFDGGDFRAGSIRGTQAQLKHVLSVLDDFRMYSEQLEEQLDKVTDTVMTTEDEKEEAKRMMEHSRYRRRSSLLFDANRGGEAAPVRLGVEHGVDDGHYSVNANIEELSAQGRPYSEAASGLSGLGPGGRAAALRTENLEAMLMRRGENIGFGDGLVLVDGSGGEFSNSSCSVASGVEARGVSSRTGSALHLQGGGVSGGLGLHPRMSRDSQVRTSLDVRSKDSQVRQSMELRQPTDVRTSSLDMQQQQQAIRSRSYTAAPALRQPLASAGGGAGPWRVSDTVSNSLGLGERVMDSSPSLRQALAPTGRAMSPTGYLGPPAADSGEEAHQANSRSLYSLGAVEGNHGPQSGGSSRAINPKLGSPIEARVVE